jgi:hypothetical protein
LKSEVGGRKKLSIDRLRVNTLKEETTVRRLGSLLEGDDMDMDLDMEEAVLVVVNRDFTWRQGGSGNKG